MNLNRVRPWVCHDTVMDFDCQSVSFIIFFRSYSTLYINITLTSATVINLFFLHQITYHTWKLFLNRYRECNVAVNFSNRCLFSQMALSYEHWSLFLRYNILHCAKTIFFEKFINLWVVALVYCIKNVNRMNFLLEWERFWLLS